MVHLVKEHSDVWCVVGEAVVRRELANHALHPIGGGIGTGEIPEWIECAPRLRRDSARHRETQREGERHGKKRRWKTREATRDGGRA